YYRARYYDSQTGRFLSEDPARFGAGPDFYPYVGNNATNLRDPLGLNAAPAPVPTPGPTPWFSFEPLAIAGLAYADFELAALEYGYIHDQIQNSRPDAGPMLGGPYSPL